MAKANSDKVNRPASIKNKIASTSNTSIAVPKKKIATQKDVIKKKRTTQISANQKIKGISSPKIHLSITFQIRYSTTYGQNIFLTGNHILFGNNNVNDAVIMQYLNQDYWLVTMHLTKKQCINQEIIYNYLVKNADGSIINDWGTDKRINLSEHKGELLIIDAWNFAGYYGNVFYTEPFKEVLLRDNVKQKNNLEKTASNATHIFKIKSPLLKANETLCLIGNNDSLKNWDVHNPLLMQLNGNKTHYTTSVNLINTNFPIIYKYGVYNIEHNYFVCYEEGNNRILFDNINSSKKTIVNDGFAALPATTWKGAGVSMPVFSLKTKQSYGIGDFGDMQLLIDWAAQCSIKLIQLLPVNDTSATLTNVDSYPYAAISAFALHPAYLNIELATDKRNKKVLTKYQKEKQLLNEETQLNYRAVIKLKWKIIQELFALQHNTLFKSESYSNFFETNKHWLIPYACFCYLKESYGTSNFNEWPAFKEYDATAITELSKNNSAAYNDIAIHFFVQFHLYKQLQAAKDFAHEKGIVLKGDIPIGIYRHSADAWQNKELYNMQMQAGAPPDDFAVKGQNWGFPTYNWQKMKADEYRWWKERFMQMSSCFDAFRIDHILGFFRIWSIPLHAVEGIMGYFVPANPIHINELHINGIHESTDRLTIPYITDHTLQELANTHTQHIIKYFLDKKDDGTYQLKKEFETQKQVQDYFQKLKPTQANKELQEILFNLISNVILFYADDNPQCFHCRFNMQQTTSYQHLSTEVQEKLNQLYNRYFFEQQEQLWKTEALEKLPALKKATNMLVFGEDLGLVPSSVPDVMQQLGLLSLEIQRMPKQMGSTFFHPNNAPYLSVVTPSTHDMSTLRGWWQEDKTLIQLYYNTILQKEGNAPDTCETWISKEIILQHLYSPAMWCIVQLQDLLGMDEKLRRENIEEERINIPANPSHYWCYRMHLTIEELMGAKDFNFNLKKMVELSGR